MSSGIRALIFCGFLLPSVAAAEGTVPVKVFTYPLREEMKLIVTAGTRWGESGAAFTTVRGEVWTLDDAEVRSDRFRDFRWTRFASGLRRPAAIWSRGSDLVVDQATETTLLRDEDGDGVADAYLVDDAANATGEGRGPDNPFLGFLWLETPEEEGPFAGQYFGASRSEPRLCRLCITSDERGRHVAVFHFADVLRYPADAIVPIGARIWLVAQSNRRAPDRSRTKFALQRLTLENPDPFEVLSVRATDSGFHLRFTRPLLRETAAAHWAYRVEALDAESGAYAIASVRVDEDLRGVTLNGPAPMADRAYLIRCPGVWSTRREPVRNPSALFIWDGGESNPKEK